MIDTARLAKFKRRAPKMASQAHLDRAMFTFHPDHHEEIATHVQPLLRQGLTARKVEALPELQINDPDNPSLHESTVQRLNNHAAQVAQLQAEIAALKAEIADRDDQIKNLRTLILKNA